MRRYFRDGLLEVAGEDEGRWKLTLTGAAKSYFSGSSRRARRRFRAVQRRQMPCLRPPARVRNWLALRGPH